MSKTRIIKNKDELNKLRAEIMGSLDQSVVMIQELMSSMDSLSFFKKIKFEKTVTDSFTGEPENFAEMIDQCQTYLVTIMGAEYLLDKFPDDEFTIHLGNISGYDIMSKDGSIIAECFASMESIETLENNKSIKLSKGELNVFVDMIYDYTLNLANDNGFDLKQIKKPSSKKNIVDLQKYLDVQKQIFAVA